MSAAFAPHPEAPVYTIKGTFWRKSRADMISPVYIGDRMVCDIHAIRRGRDFSDTKARLRALGWRPHQVEAFARRALARAVVFKGEVA